MHWLAEHWQENAIALVLAVVFAMVFAIIADAMSIGSHVREVLRRFKNKRAERSVTRLRERIKVLQHRRKMLASRTAVLLLALQSTLSYVRHVGEEPRCGCGHYASLAPSR